MITWSWSNDANLIVKIKKSFFVTDIVRSLITSSTQQVNALTAEMKVEITKQGLTYCGTNPTKHNSGQKWCGGFLFIFFMTPTFHLNQQNTKEKKNTD